ncbi:MAG: geraniol dehydrogenase [Nevskia sp.]|nr:geraniol dehydrogenase [Nevskia sp.]
MTTSVQSFKASAAIVRNVGGPFTIESIDVAAPSGDQVLVRMVGVGICHTDLVCRDGFPVPMPIVLGHEGSGIVEAIGDKVTGVKVGDHVVLSFNSCQSCPNCAKSQPAYCYNFLANNFAGVRPSDGSTSLAQNGAAVHGQFFGQSSFATLAIAREINTVVIDKNLPLEIMGPLGCGIQTGAGGAVNSLEMQKGDSLAIFGGGAVGLSALLGARAIDAGTVIVIEPNAARGELAKQLGATHVINPKETPDVLAKIKELSGGGVNYALDTTGIPAVMGVAIETMLPRGMLGLIGVPPPDANLPANLMSMLIRGARVKYITEGDSNPQEFIPRMLGWYKAGKFPFDRLISKFRFEQINEAAHATETGAAIKPVLVF